MKLRALSFQLVLCCTVIAGLSYGQSGPGQAKVQVNKVISGGAISYLYKVINVSGSPIAQVTLGTADLDTGDPELITVPTNWDLNTNINPGSVRAPSGWKSGLTLYDESPFFTITWTSTSSNSRISQGQTLAGFMVMLTINDDRYRTADWTALRTDGTTTSGIIEALEPLILGDVDGDGTVTCSDASIVKAAFGRKAGDLGFDPRADVNNDGVVDIKDLAFVSQKLAAGTKCP